MNKGLLLKEKMPGRPRRCLRRSGRQVLLGGTALGWLALAFGGGLLVLPHAANAQQAQTSSSDPASATQAGNGIQLNTVTVQGTASTETGAADPVSYVATSGSTATKTDTPLIEVPQSVSVITEKEMSDRGVKDLEDALAYTAGVQADQWGRDDRYQSFVIRGFDEGTKGVYRDGMSENIGGWFTTSRMEPYGLERVEVFKGSTSTLYGSNEPGGMVNATTKRPTTEPLHEVEVSYGSFNQKEIKSDFSGAVDSKGEWSYRLTSLLRDGDTQEDHSQNNRLYVAPALTWRPNEKAEITFLSDYYKVETTAANGVPEQLIGALDREAFLGEPGSNFFNTDQKTLGYQASYKLDNGLKISNSARYSHTDVDYETVYQRAYDASTDSMTRTAFVLSGTSDRMSMDTNAQYDWNTAWFKSKLLGGVELRRTHTDESYQTGETTGLNNVSSGSYSYAGTPAITALDTDFDWDVDQTAVALYVQDQIKIADHWVVTAGGRQDWVKTTVRGNEKVAGSSLDEDLKDQAFTMRGGLSYLFNNGLTPYVSYSESFNPVVFNAANGYTDADGNRVRPEPTEGKQYEVGLKYVPTFMDAVFTVAGFDLTQTNVVKTDPNTGAASQIGEVQVKGIELEGRINMWDGWSAVASYTIQDAEITKSLTASEVGTRPDRVADQMASAWLSYAFGSGIAKGLTLGGGVRYTGDSVGYDGNGDKQVYNGYALFDASVNYQLFDGLTWSLTGKNLADKQYVSTCYYGTCYYGDAMTINTSLKYSW